MYNKGTYPNEDEVQAKATHLVKKYKGKVVTSMHDFIGHKGIACPHCGMVIDDLETWGNGGYMNSFTTSPQFPFQKVIECVCGKSYLIVEREENLWVNGKRQGGYNCL